MFSVGDRVVHPMHGAGVIEQIVTETVAGSTQDYYVFHMPVGGLVLKIPTASSEMVGLRGVWDPAKSLQFLRELTSMKANTMEKLKSGDLYQVAQVIKNLTCRDSEKGLSTGERKMLRTAKQILITEMVLSIGQSYQQIEELVNLSFLGGA